jgi:hypothetical protein
MDLAKSTRSPTQLQNIPIFFGKKESKFMRIVYSPIYIYSK